MSFFKVLTLEPSSWVILGSVWFESSQVIGQPAAAATNVGPVSFPIAPIALLAVVAKQSKSWSEKSIIFGASNLIFFSSSPSEWDCPRIIESIFFSFK